MLHQRRWRLRVRSAKDLRAVYPTGLVLIRDEAALSIDFEEEVGRVNVSYAAAR